MKKFNPGDTAYLLIENRMMKVSIDTVNTVDRLDTPPIYAYVLKYPTFVDPTYVSGDKLFDSEDALFDDLSRELRENTVE